MKRFFSSAIIVALSLPAPILAEVRFTITDLEYQGAARIPIGNIGASTIAYAEGTFTVSDDQSSLFVVGHNHDQAIGEFRLPEFSKAEALADVPISDNIQPFAEVFDRIPSGNPEGINRITGLELVNGQLVANALRFYDGGADNTDTTFVIEQANALDSSPITGFLKLEGSAHAGGWMTKLPPKYHDSFRGDYIFGFASNFPINGRSSIGPSAFSVDMTEVVSANTGQTIPTFPLIDYSLENPLVEDRYNNSGNNRLWTEVSNALVGFVVPGSNTYAVFGSSGGHDSGIGYKITQDDGNLCGGACPYDASDEYNYYWLYDLEDMASVAQGALAPHDLVPYEYGKLDLPFEDQNGSTNLLIGAEFNESTGRLYLMLGKVDQEQSQYAKAPLLLAYSVKFGVRPMAPSSLRAQ